MTEPRRRRWAVLLAMPVLSAALVLPAQAGPGILMGRVVDSETGNPVAGAVVESWDELLGAVEGTGTTHRGGVFRIAPLVGEEHGVYVEGPQGYESGWLGCDLTVVPSFGDACTHSLGNLGRIRLDPM